MRYVRFREWLAGVARAAGENGISRVVFEEVRRHAGTDAAHVYGGYLGVLLAWGEETGIPCEGVPVGEIKKFATGRGNADKDAMVDAARRRGFAPIDDNEADALWLLLLAIQKQG